MPDFSGTVVTALNQVVRVNSSVPGSYGQVPLLSLGVVSVKDPTYGATGDGTTDDSTAVIAALAAVSTGGVLFFPKGSYNLATWVVQALTKQVTLLGLDRESTTLTGPGTTDFLTTSKGLSCQGLKFTNWGEVFTLDPITTTIAGITVRDSWFDDTSVVVDWQGEQGGALVQSLLVKDNRFTNLTSFGVLAQGPIDTFQATGNTFDTVLGRAIQVGENTFSKQEGWKNLIVTQNTFRNITVTGSVDPAAVLLYGYRCDISDNVIDTVTGGAATECWGIYTKVKYGTISHNTIKGLTTGTNVAGINIKGSLRGATSSPNGYAIECHGNVIECGGVGSGIRSEGDDHLVYGNFVDDPGADGIGVDASSGNRNCIRGNHLYGTARAGAIGVRLSSGVSTEVCTDNLIHNFLLGVRVSSATLTTTDVEVSRNTFTSCTQCIVVTFNTGTALVARFTAQANRGDTATSGIAFEGTGATSVAHLLNNVFTNTTNPITWSSTANMPVNLVMRGNTGWTITPTTATTTTVASLPLADEGAYMVKAFLVAKRSDSGARAYYERGALVYRDAAGSATSQGTTTDVSIESDAAWDGVLDVSGNNFRVRFTSSADTITVQAQIDVWGVN